METRRRRGAYRRYDHRLKALVAAGGDADLVKTLGVPASTVRTWRRRQVAPVLSLDIAEQDSTTLRARAIELERKCGALEAKLELHESLRTLMGWRVELSRFPGAEAKERFIRLVEAALGRLSLKECLRAIGLSLSRYKSWKIRQRKCELPDHSSCPKMTPTKLTPREALAMAEMVQEKRYAHFPIRALAFYAARTGGVVASATTWLRRIAAYGWRRPRRRIYPVRPRIGLRAARPNEYWHIDTTIFRLLDGTRAVLQACIDNFSRYVLAWRISRTPTGAGCRELLLKALRKAIELNPLQGPARVICDSGIENVNRFVEELIEQGRIVREIAQLEIDYSNSLVEAFFRSAKNNYFYLQGLSGIEVLGNHAGFYIREHNEVMPHSAFRGGDSRGGLPGGMGGAGGILVNQGTSGGQEPADRPSSRAGGVRALRGGSPRLAFSVAKV